MTTAGYNGWANWETWNVVLWARNHEASYRKWVNAAQEHDGNVLALSQYLENVMPAWYNLDMKKNSKEYAQVDWLEVAEACAEEIL